MASSAEIQAKILKLEINMDRLNNIVNGASTLDVEIDSGTVPSISKFLAAIGTTAGGYVTMAQAASTSASGFSDKAALWAESPSEVEPGKRSAKYWAGVATGAVAGVSSFNGRSGNVTPTSGDYTTTTVTRGAGTLEASLTTIESNITTNGNLATANATSVDLAHKNISILALDMADIKGIRNGMAGGIADPYDSEDGINLGTINNGIDSNTVSCFHFDATNGKRVAIDDGFGIIKNKWDVFGTASITTAQSKFGGSCLSVGGNGGLAIQSAPSSFTFGTGDFTIDTWFRRANVGVGDIIYECRPDAANTTINMVFYVGSTNFMQYYAGGSVRITGTTLIAANTWYHMAIVRNSGVVKMYLNGVQEGPSFTDTTNIAYSGLRPIIGMNYNGTGSQMFLDELRVSKVARWTSNFTPPSTPYSEMGGTSTANQIYDSSSDYYAPESAGTTVLSVPPAGGSNASVPNSLRTIIDGTGILSGGSSFRVRLTSGGTTVITNSFLGRKAASGNPYDMDTVSSTPVRITFGGANGVTIVSGEVWSDWIPFTIGVSDLVIAWDLTTGSYTPVRGDTSLSYASYFKSNVAEAGTPVVSGYTASLPNARYLITGMEVRNNSVTYADLTLESVPITALAVPTSSRLSIQVSGSATLTPNTDIIGQVSRDGGTTWTSVNLALTENYSGIRQFEGTASLTSQPSGTSMKYRVQIFNDKNALISGAVQQWS